jgi:hypothetical protein
MTLFKIVHLDLTTGKRTWMPWAFQSQEEALEKIMDLTSVDPRQSFIVMLAPVPAMA